MAAGFGAGSGAGVAVFERVAFLGAGFVADFDAGFCAGFGALFGAAFEAVFVAAFGAAFGAFGAGVAAATEVALETAVEGAVEAVPALCIRIRLEAREGCVLGFLPRLGMAPIIRSAPFTTRAVEMRMGLTNLGLFRGRLFLSLLLNRINRTLRPLQSRRSINSEITNILRHSGRHRPISVRFALILIQGIRDFYSGVQLASLSSVRGVIPWQTRRFPRSREGRVPFVGRPGNVPPFIVVWVVGVGAPD